MYHTIPKATQTKNSCKATEKSHAFKTVHFFFKFYDRLNSIFRFIFGKFKKNVKLFGCIFYLLDSPVLTLFWQSSQKASMQ